MNNKETLQTYNTQLSTNNLTIDEIITKVNKLPEAGSAVEDLTTELETYNNHISTQDNIIDDIITALQDKGSGSGASLNIFVQEEEPELKRGIWLKTNEYTKQQIFVVDENDIVISEGGTWDTDGAHINLPHHNGYACATAVDTIMYYCGGQDAYAYDLYAYDTVANQYTALKDIPFKFGWGGFCALDGCLYFFGGRYATTTAYKYDIANDYYTKLANIPVGFVSVVATPLNGKIYLITGRPDANSSTRYNTIYEYDPLNDTYKLANATIHSGDCKGAVGFGNSLYIFGSDQNPNTCYRYDPTTDTSTKMNNIPFNCVDTYACATNDAIYLVGSSKSAYALWKYNPVADAYVQLTNVPYSTWGPVSGALIENKQLFAIGDTSNHVRVQVYNIQEIIYPETPENCILIDQSEVVFKTIFFGDIRSYFRTILYRLNGEQIKDISIYYGTGTEWKNIKGGV